MKTLVVVVGAGPVGCLVALRLAQSPLGKSYQILLLEKRNLEEQQQQEEEEGKRSINLALSERGRASLRCVGLEQVILQRSVPMWGRALHDTGIIVTGFQAYDDVKQKECIYSVSRREINDVLLEAVKKQGNVQVRMGMEVSRIEIMDQGEVMIECVVGGGKKERINNVASVFGCDGAHSIVRNSFRRIAPADIHCEYIEHGYVELCIPPNKATSSYGGDFVLPQPEALHIWPRDRSMFIALPNPDKSFTATLFAPYAELRRFDSPRRRVNENNNDNDDEFWTYFESQFGKEIASVVQKSRGRPYPLFSATVKPWVYSNCIALFGDAAHTQVPFFGQGMNAGLEDVLCFFELMEKFDDDLTRVFQEYDRVRRPCGDAVTTLSRLNYDHMHTHAASPIFRAWKRVEGTFARWTGGRYLPLYYAVAFTRTPYDVALKREMFREAMYESSVKFVSVMTLGLVIVWSLMKVRDK